MILIFGKNNCISCAEYKEKLNREKKEYVFYDLDTVDGLVAAAERGLITKCEKSLPVIVEED